MMAYAGVSGGVMFTGFDIKRETKKVSYKDLVSEEKLQTTVIKSDKSEDKEDLSKAA